MYKVFLADDEASMREGVRNNVKWDGSDFVLAGEAPDGELALSLMQEIMPDILITDVRMPFMDGLELSKIIKKAMPWVKIIILSGHDEFEYAQQAITIGIEEYLLKPVTSEKLMEALKKVAARIEAEKSSLRNVENLINDARRVRADRLLSDLLYGNITLEKALPLAEELNISIASDYYLVMLIELRDQPQDSHNAAYRAFACITGILNDWDNIVYFIQGLDRVVCVLKGGGDGCGGSSSGSSGGGGSGSGGSGSGGNGSGSSGGGAPTWWLLGSMAALALTRLLGKNSKSQYPNPK